MHKYQLKPDRYSSHSQILLYLKAHGQGCRILDVGTAQGMLGRGLCGVNCHLTGIEIDPELAKLARPFYNDVIVGDISHLMLHGQFDFIVFADVLEHLADPLTVLMQTRQLLSPDGQVIISLPNVANLYVRLKLLFGRFDYEKRGICDTTHLRFYTRSTAMDLLDRAGYQISRCWVTPIPFALRFPALYNNAGGRTLSLLTWMMTKIWPTLLAYQFIFIANPTNSLAEEK